MLSVVVEIFNRLFTPSSHYDLSTGTIKVWEKSSFGSVRQELNRLRRELESVRRSSLRSGPTRRERQLMARLSELLTREEVMEKQRSRIEWLREGDRNTSFFQARSKERVRINRISALRRDDGSIATNQEAPESTSLEFYSKLFTRQEALDPGPVLACVKEKVTPEMNDDL